MSLEVQLQLQRLRLQRGDIVAVTGSDEAIQDTMSHLSKAKLPRDLIPRGGVPIVPVFGGCTIEALGEKELLKVGLVRIPPGPADEQAWWDQLPELERQALYAIRAAITVFGLSEARTWHAVAAALSAYGDTLQANLQEIQAQKKFIADTTVPEQPRA